MRVIVATIIVWAILLGFFVTGVRVMATSPATRPVQTSLSADDNVRPQATLERDNTASNEIRAAGDNGLRINR